MDTIKKIFLTNFEFLPDLEIDNKTYAPTNNAYEYKGKIMIEYKLKSTSKNNKETIN